ncbi:type VI secretion protein IcmF/TssM N-terminal domain-containing protein [Bradyrhizobium sp. RDT10]
MFAGKRGPSYLFELPWYIIIGPSRAGKTTILRNSGLEFPLAERLGVDPVAGVGGTRNCDWWFTEEAVFIDTASRYTTQDTDVEVDRAAWHGFLNLLTMHRRRRPINGILVAISLSDLSTADGNRRRLVQSISFADTGAGQDVWHAHSGLCSGNQMRSGTWLHRVFRRSRP